MRRRIRWILPCLVAVAAIAAATGAASSHANPPAGGATATPIKHVVVIFQENVSFDHYFGTYPFATNTDGNPFAAKQGTPAVNGLNFSLLAANPNASNPQRLGSSVSDQLTCDQDHNYSDEQEAEDGGKMDLFVQSVGTDGGTKTPDGSALCDPKTVMDYYDGNSVTGLWNYAQHYAMSDNSFGTTFGPSAPGAINLAAGDTGDVDMAHTVNQSSAFPIFVSTPTNPNGDVTPDGKGGYSLTSDAQPYWDDCSTRDAVALKGQNIGDVLNQRGLSWGWFEGGFAPTTRFADAAAAPEIGHPGQSTATFIPDEFKGSFNGKVTPPGASNQGLCNADHAVGTAFGANLSNVNGTPKSDPYGAKDDYIPHHEPFEYYASTANPHHLAPANLSAIGTDTQSYVHGEPQFNTANHNYDTSDFDQLVSAITAGTLSPDHLPAVSLIKAPGYQDGHAAYSDPTDEQAFVVHIINELEQSPDWSSTAVIVNYDDSDGWYDHVFGPVVNPSHSVADNLTNTVFDTSPRTKPVSELCTARNDKRHGRPGRQHGPGGSLAGEQGRCGFGPRLPMMVISPWAKTNYVDGNLSNQASIINFVEYNWHLPGIKGSFDQVLDPLDHQEGVKFDLGGMFDFNAAPNTTQFILDPTTGEPTGP
jgi:phospholipase C